MRAMARRPDGTEQALVELQGRGRRLSRWSAPCKLVGRHAARRRHPARARRGRRSDPARAPRRLKVGDRLSIGTIEVPIRATIEAEPDKLTERLTVGPRVLVSLDTLQRAGLIDPGSLVGWRYALKLGNGAGGSEAGLVEFRDAVKQALPEGGFTVRDRRDPSPQVSRTLERLRQFLTLVGLTALLVGGVGIANAVATYIDRRRKVIAAFKSLGATSAHDLRRASAAGADDRRHRRRDRHGAGPSDPGRAHRRCSATSLPIKAEFNRHARAACSPPRPTASWWRCCSRCGRSGAPSRCAPACCSATRWRRSACCRAGASSP